MCATDVEPNRLTAAQAAVREFIENQDPGTRIGLVLFAGSAQIAVAPTTEREPVLQAVDSLTTARGTTIGAAILKSVDAIAEINPDVEPAGADEPAGEGVAASPAPGVGYAPEIVVLLTDGANTTGIEPVPAAHVAAARGVRVYPIGFGTTNPTRMVCTAEQLGGRAFERSRPGGFGRGGPPRNFLVADEETLREVATITGGTYFSASGADQLQGVLADLPRQVETTRQDVEVSAALAGLAVLLLLSAAWAAARWSAFPG
jgi:Ca-activated chloride channel family protein